jgi:hypothetical protein
MFIEAFGVFLTKEIWNLFILICRQWEQPLFKKAVRLKLKWFRRLKLQLNVHFGKLLFYSFEIYD